MCRNNDSMNYNPNLAPPSGFAATMAPPSTALEQHDHHHHPHHHRVDDHSDDHSDDHHSHHFRETPSPHSSSAGHHSDNDSHHHDHHEHHHDEDGKLAAAAAAAGNATGNNINGADNNNNNKGGGGARFPTRFHHFVTSVDDPDVCRWIGEEGVFINEDHPLLGHYLEEYFNNGSLNSLKAKLYAYGWKKRCGRSKKAVSEDRIWLHVNFHPDPAKCDFASIKCRQRSGNRFLHQQEGSAAHNGTIDETDNDCGMAFPTQKRGFPTLLHKFVNDTSHTHPEVVHWTDRGDSFYVQLDHPHLNEVLRPYFKHGNYLSLRRQLYAYGFTKKRRRRDQGVLWQHPSFQRDGIAGCGVISRGPNW